MYKNQAEWDAADSKAWAEWEAAERAAKEKRVATREDGRDPDGPYGNTDPTKRGRWLGGKR